MVRKIKLQNILLPKGEPYTSLYKMYDRGEEKKIREDGVMILERGDVFDASTYFNSCSMGKWLEYTNLSDIALRLKIKGDFTLKLFAYSVEDVTPFEENAEFALETREKVLLKQEFSNKEPEEILIEYPATRECLVSFLIIAHNNCEFYQGSYEGSVLEENIRPVELSMAITTFKKEEFVLPNIELLRKEILQSEEEIAEHFQVHVVDNGRTLSTDAAGHNRIQIHPNINAGGSGGFARGMIETLNQQVKATHLLLMDDDVLIQTESIKRTYTLLKILKKEYEDHFLSGAMLFYENMHVQHEDVGYVKSQENGGYGPVKRAMDFYKIEDCCYNEIAPLNQKNQYAGWWYCCIPMKYVREDNLPLPLFVRGDDVEYSLRNQAKFITMNGICVWHMGFTRKFNAMMELYQVHRNSLIYQAVSQICQDCNFINRMEYFVRVELMRFNYNSAELLLDALDDYMKGPDFLKKPLGEEIIKEKSKKNEKLVPLSEISQVPVEIGSLYTDAPYSKVEFLIHRLTYNGHKLPKRMLKEETAVIPYDWFCAIGKQYLHKRLLAVNPHTMEGAIRQMDKKRASQIRKRASKTFKQCRKRQPELTKLYHEKQKEFTSIEFWKEYLGI